MSTTNERSQNDIVVGDGVVTVVPFQFNYFSDSNISVLVTLRDEADPLNIVETELIEATDYVLFDDRIELANPLLTDQFLLVERIVKDVQPLDYDDLRPFPEEIHERQEDRTFMSLSEIKNRFKRTPMFNKFNENEIAIEDPVDGNYLKFTYDPIGDVWSISNDVSTIDLSNYYTIAEVDQLQSDQDTALQNYADQAVIDMGDLKVDKGGIVAGTGINVSGTGSVADPLVVESSGGLSAPTGEVLFGTGSGVGSSPDLKVAVGGGAALIEGVDEIELTAGTLLGFDAPNISMRSNRVQDVAAPVNPSDAVNKEYVYSHSTAINDEVDFLFTTLEVDLNTDTDFDIVNTVEGKSVVLAVTNIHGSNPITLSFYSQDLGFEVFHRPDMPLEMDAGTINVYTFVAVGSRIYVACVDGMELP